MIKILDKDLLTVKKGLILHQVNCCGVMGSGVALQIRNKYPIVYDKYMELCNHYKSNLSKLLGVVQIVKINENLYVANLFAQKDYGSNKQYTNLDALKKCLLYIRNTEFQDIALPYKMSSARGGANWDDVYTMINENLNNKNIYICRRRVYGRKSYNFK